jgi:hypothetical protein
MGVSVMYVWIVRVHVLKRLVDMLMRVRFLASPVIVMLVAAVSIMKDRRPQRGRGPKRTMTSACYQAT